MYMDSFDEILDTECMFTEADAMLCKTLCELVYHEAFCKLMESISKALVLCLLKLCSIFAVVVVKIYIQVLGFCHDKREEALRVQHKMLGSHASERLTDAFCVVKSAAMSLNEY